MSLTKQEISRFIKEEAYRLGFDQCGIAPSGFLEEEAPRLEKWLDQNYQGEMAYMADHFDKRLNPGLLVDDARSVISLSFNYFTEKKQTDPTAPKISKYAYGKDYHFVIKSRLRELAERIAGKIGEFNYRGFVDSAPVMDKAWAKKGGIGWIGKHTNLISKTRGSYFFLAELIIDRELAYDQPFETDHCGTCTRCIDACPTGAITEAYVVDGSKCISYFTIELKGGIPEGVAGKFDDWMFGCDVCQDVCPWNRFSKEHTELNFEPHPDLLSMTRKEWDELTRETFNEIFRKSAVKRTGYTGLIRNIEFLKRD